MTKQDVHNNRVELSTVGLDDEMILRMTSEEIDQYFTAENFTAMFGECNMSQSEMSTWRMATHGQKYLLQNLDLLD